MDRATFKNPPKAFRAAPFWSWNDDLEPEELVRQVGLMDEAGWGGFFMHSRVGLITPYLSERWMECIRAAVAEAKCRGMSAYLYDEDKWPSGFAGGLVPAQKREYRDLALMCKVNDRPAVVEEHLALFKARFEAGQLSDFQAIGVGGSIPVSNGRTSQHWYEVGRTPSCYRESWGRIRRSSTSTSPATSG